MPSSASRAFLPILWSEQYCSISLISSRVIISFPFLCKCRQKNSRLQYAFYRRLTQKERHVHSMWETKNPALTDANRTETTQISDLSEALKTVYPTIRWTLLESLSANRISYSVKTLSAAKIRIIRQIVKIRVEINLSRMNCCLQGSAEYYLVT